MKKEWGFIIFLVIIAIIVVVILLFKKELKKECDSNSNCSTTQICGPNFKCINNCVGLCASDETCNILTGSCDKKCSSSNPCPSGSICNDATGECNQK